MNHKHKLATFYTPTGAVTLCDGCRYRHETAETNIRLPDASVAICTAFRGYVSLRYAPSPPLRQSERNDDEPETV